MTKADAAWMVPFLRDLAEFAEERGLEELHADLEAVITKHGSALSQGSAAGSPGAQAGLSSWDHALDLPGARGKRRSH